MGRHIYVASSWRCLAQPGVVVALRGLGHEVYDFKNPEPGNHGFAWSSIDPAWEGWEPERFRALLGHEVAEKGFELDWNAMVMADTCVLVLPCGRSAHLEAGFFVGAQKELHILMLQKEEPELMYKMADGIHCYMNELFDALDKPHKWNNRVDPGVVHPSESGRETPGVPLP